MAKIEVTDHELADIVRALHYYADHPWAIPSCYTRPIYDLIHKLEPYIDDRATVDHSGADC